MEHEADLIEAEPTGPSPTPKIEGFTPPLKPWPSRTPTGLGQLLPIGRPHLEAGPHRQAAEITAGLESRRDAIFADSWPFLLLLVV